MAEMQIEFDVPAEMRDGTVLRAGVYRPAPPEHPGPAQHQHRRRHRPRERGPDDPRGHHIHHGPNHPSRLVLPLIDRKDQQ
ncbi:hypothetical protein OHB06_50825 [Streptomyces sp. NBC_01604]|uniref:hypothetical protein n=1 Tax=Streptomyces sp. NBC_01604 TaxID=2975894 RepID=UPI00386A74A5